MESFHVSQAELGMNRTRQHPAMYLQKENSFLCVIFDKQLSLYMSTI